MNDEKNEGANESTPAAGSRLAVAVPEPLKWLRSPKALHAEMCAWVNVSVWEGMKLVLPDLAKLTLRLERGSPLDVAAEGLFGDGRDLRDLAGKLGERLEAHDVDSDYLGSAPDEDTYWQRRLRADSEVDMEILGKVVVQAQRMYKNGRAFHHKLVLAHHADPENLLLKELADAAQGWVDQIELWELSSQVLWCGVLATQVIQGQSVDQPARVADQKDRVADRVASPAAADG